VNDRIIEGDALEEMRELPDSCIDLIATDPPYYKVKGEAWDRQWETPELFLEWLSELRDEWYRLLKPNGSLYVFVSPKMAARVECLIAEKFNILNQIRWIKQLHTSWRIGREIQRMYLPPWEGIVFAEHYGADNSAKGEPGYGGKCDELRGFVFEPLRAYLEEERTRAGMDKACCNEACGFSKSAGGMASRHYFSRSQWALPTKEHYKSLRELFNRDGGEFLRREHEDLCCEYEDLRRKYEDLSREYEELRRPFDVAGNMPRTDTWNFKAVQSREGRHPCEKPLALMEHIIRVSSRPGAVVLDCFAGSGTTCVAARNLGRRYIGIENNAGYIEQINERLSREQQCLFA